ncbi:hypothetical protein V1512DRAFT_262363 [Lipomyces arxii]|uniref:uncharacterized protein n=1 Tax=Lipomyces arxii TaxID=56418 RepID=UPI0034CDA230
MSYVASGVSGWGVKSFQPPIPEFDINQKSTSNQSWRKRANANELVQNDKQRVKIEVKTEVKTEPDWDSRVLHFKEKSFSHARNQFKQTLVEENQSTERPEDEWALQMPLATDSFMKFGMKLVKMHSLLDEHKFLSKEIKYKSQRFDKVEQTAWAHMTEIQQQQYYAWRLGFLIVPAIEWDVMNAPVPSGSALATFERRAKALRSLYRPQPVTIANAVSFSSRNPGFLPLVSAIELIHQHLQTQPSEEGAFDTTELDEFEVVTLAIYYATKYLPLHQNDKHKGSLESVNQAIEALRIRAKAFENAILVKCNAVV